eukprot:7628301-Lingulodinium_polyedra.AAC.1
MCRQDRPLPSLATAGLALALVLGLGTSAGGAGVPEEPDALRGRGERGPGAGNGMRSHAGPLPAPSRAPPEGVESARELGEVHEVRAAHKLRGGQQGAAAPGPARAGDSHTGSGEDTMSD